MADRWNSKLIDGTGNRARSVLSSVRHGPSNRLHRANLTKHERRSAREDGTGLAVSPRLLKTSVESQKRGSSTNGRHL